MNIKKINKNKLSLFLIIFLFLIFTNLCGPINNNDPYRSVEMESLLGVVEIFPENDPWNTDISASNVDSNSDAIIDNIGRDDNFHPAFGTTWEGMPNGIPYVVVDNSQEKVYVTFDYEDESDEGLYPIPDDYLIEAGSDAHILIVHKDEKMLYELFAAEKQSDGSWHAGSGAIFDLTKTNPQRPDGWTSADAAGLAILPGLIRYEEVEAGEINHAIRFTLQNSKVRNAFVHPATHSANSGNDSSNQPPMGARFRLKSSFVIDDSFSANVQVILTAMKKYGLILADNGSNWYIIGTPDPRWDDDELAELKQLTGDDFEVIKLGTIYNQDDY